MKKIMKLLQKTLPYSLVNHYPEERERRRYDFEEKERLYREEQARKKEQENEEMRQAFIKLRTLPINIEYILHKEVGTNPRDFAQKVQEAKYIFGMREAEILNKFADLLKGTPYALFK